MTGESAEDAMGRPQARRVLGRPLLRKEDYNMPQPQFPASCGAVQYSLSAAPMFIHACHCRDCQVQKGEAFATHLR